MPERILDTGFKPPRLLVLSDFGGTRRPRAIAYLSATLVGAALVALGTLVSFSPALAVGVMLIVGFVISFSRIFGGYIAAANTGMLLAFVIAVTIPGPTSVIPARVGGWTMAGLVSTLAAVTLWPRFERVTMQQQAANAVDDFDAYFHREWLRGLFDAAASRLRDACAARGRPHRYALFEQYDLAGDVDDLLG